MKQLIARLRELEAAVDETGDDEIRVAHGWPEYAEAVLKALPQLLDRLEKLEAVAERARQYRNCYMDDNEKITGKALDNALAALEDK